MDGAGHSNSTANGILSLRSIYIYIQIQIQIYIYICVCVQAYDYICARLHGNYSHIDVNNVEETS